MTKSRISTFALAATLAIGLSAALTGMASAQTAGGGGGGGGGAGGPGDFSSIDRLPPAQINLPPTHQRTRATHTEAGGYGEVCTFSRYYQTMVCERTFRR
ncbi:hypothetical protein E8L99_10960 [Phreatobacter aquaticus]|uniref:Uncharacterized protein n=1 Tax=Phreatobacter aquaticus TaxID=2570229 RepID=A0A4D7QH74_9HYPH|nr:hypothetical protein [Phreatobacter aquaticus]QCK86235.1 hypothetical protein E8L99_10960 [Phreatobacter aquaticus]